MRRNGFGAFFWCRFLDIEKAYKIETQLLVGFVAEREGFEPPEQLPVHRISSAAQSTSLASFQFCAAKVHLYTFKTKHFFIFYNHSQPV